MYAVIKKAVFDIDGLQVKANFKILGRALETGLSTAVLIFLIQLIAFFVFKGLGNDVKNNNFFRFVDATRNLPRTRSISAGSIFAES